MDDHSELRIHAEVSAALSYQLDPTAIEVNQAPTVVFIGRRNYKRFLLGATANLVFTHLFLVLWTIVYLQNPKLLDGYFQNYKRIGNGYDVAAVVILGLSLLAMSFSRRAARRSSKFVLIFLCHFCVAYLSAFLITKAKGIFMHNVQEVMLWFAVIYCATFGLFINSLIGTKRFNPRPGVGLALGAFLVIYLWLIYVWQIADPPMWKFFIFLGVETLLSIYLNYTVLLMLTKRYDFYLSNDWAMAYAQLHTHWMFYLWHDLIAYKNKAKPHDFNANAENHFAVKSDLPS